MTPRAPHPAHDRPAPGEIGRDRPPVPWLVAPLARRWLGLAAARLEFPEALGLLFLAVALAADALCQGPVAEFAERASIGMVGLAALYHLLDRRFVRPAPAAEREGRQRALRAGAGLTYTFVIYHSLPFVIDYVQPRLADRWLNALDVALVGWLTAGRPLWDALGDLRSPALTLWLSFAYSLQIPAYYATGLILTAQRRADEARLVFHTFSVAMWLGFVGYLVFPALGPGVYFLAAMQRSPQDNPVAWLVAGYAVARGTFPSLHAAVSLIALLTAWRHLSRGLFCVHVPLVASLWVSTIYLRHHYLPDLLAGWALAVGVVVGVPAIERWWDGLRRLATDRRTLPRSSDRLAHGRPA